MMSSFLHTIATLPPGLLMVLGALFVPFLPKMPRRIWMFGLILASATHAWSIDYGQHLTASFLGLDLILVRANEFTKPFMVVFHIAAALNIIYSIHANCRTTETSGLAYAGTAVAALYAGDFATLFVYWELTAVTSVFLILKGGSERRLGAALRYLLMQVVSGVLLLGGAAALWSQGGDLTIGALDPMSLAGGLIFFAFGIKAAFPFLNGWLQDTYPEASISGTLILSCFSTKLAIYMLVQCFAGVEALIYIGAVMTLFPAFYAVIENDLRRVLTFSLNNQLGFMVVGIGIGTELSLNGTAAHAFAHIIYKSVLFMAMGAVKLRTGTTKATELGGLWKSMPLTTIFCIVGAVSISSFPMFSGFVTKSLTIASTAQEGYLVIWFILIFASAAVLEHSGIKIPYFAFFGHDRGYKVKEAPASMLVAMGIGSLLCIVIGVFPASVYFMLPYEVTYDVWSVGHVLGEFQLLIFAILAFVLLMARGLYPPEIDATVLNADWLYRRLAPRIIMAIFRPIWAAYQLIIVGARSILFDLIRISTSSFKTTGFVSNTMSSSFAAAVFLAIFAFMLAFRFLNM